MPRLHRLRRPIAILLSLVLFIASIAAWTFSYDKNIAAVPSTTVPEVALGAMVPPLHFNNSSLPDVVAFLRDITSGKIEMDWPAIETLHIDRYTSVSTANLDP